MSVSVTPQQLFDGANRLFLEACQSLPQFPTEQQVVDAKQALDKKLAIFSKGHVTYETAWISPPHFFQLGMSGDRNLIDALEKGHQS